MPEPASLLTRSRDVVARARALKALSRVAIEWSQSACGTVRPGSGVPAPLGFEGIAVLRRFHEIRAQRLPRGRLRALLSAVLDAGIDATGADFGNVQLVNPSTGALEIAAQRGFGPDFLAFFREVREAGSACGVAMRSRRCAVVDDVRTHPTFAGSRAREIVLDAGVLAVQSTPLIAPSGELMGVISTHFRVPGRVPAPRLHLVALIARQAAAALSTK
jgi:GAF domain-containing protein